MTTIGLQQINSSQDDSDEREVHPRERKAAPKLACAPNQLSTLEAVLAAKFSEADVNNCILQQCSYPRSFFPKTPQTTNKETELLNATELEKLLLWYNVQKERGEKHKRKGNKT